MIESRMKRVRLILFREMLIIASIKGKKYTRYVCWRAETFELAVRLIAVSLSSPHAKTIHPAIGSICDFGSGRCLKDLQATRCIDHKYALLQECPRSYFCAESIICGLIGMLRYSYGGIEAYR